MDDLISRKDAIKYMANAIWHYPNYTALNVYENAEELAKDGLANVPSASWKERKRTRLKRYFFRLKVYQIWQKTQTYTVKKLTEIPPRLTQRNQH